MKVTRTPILRESRKKSFWFFEILPLSAFLIFIAFFVLFSLQSYGVIGVLRKFLNVS